MRPLSAELSTKAKEKSRAECADFSGLGWGESKKQARPKARENPNAIGATQAEVAAYDFPKI
jgi:hypothetical protein